MPCSIASGYGNQTQKSSDYFFATCLVPVLLCVAILFFLYIWLLVLYFFCTSSGSSSSYSSSTSASAWYHSKVKMVINAFAAYPLCMFLCWCPYAISMTYVIFHSSSSSSAVSTLSTDELQTLQVVLVGIGSLYGFFSCVIFFSNSREARQRWYALLFDQLTNAPIDIIVQDFSSVEIYQTSEERDSVLVSRYINHNNNNNINATSLVPGILASSSRRSLLPFIRPSDATTNNSNRISTIGSPLVRDTFVGGLTRFVAGEGDAVTGTANASAAGTTSGADGAAGATTRMPRKSGIKPNFANSFSDSSVAACFDGEF